MLSHLSLLQTDLSSSMNVNPSSPGRMANTEEADRDDGDTFDAVEDFDISMEQNGWDGSFVIVTSKA